ncbi:transcription antitermination factor NusB [Mycoplasma mycoides]|uniref:transcription antitermination factor NusB n=1 Tax=Mycoplasma mycoides TaxID=2102 RepID=UPI00223F7A95|nr:transcription antitermination factor NusB [Mycoplasma mycoides]QVK02891.1 transcription antitermination factor NusB [Mycoplasma mycoides subsp. capri]QVK03709.1 transcription antitermination factor NusB [Mycoplasma mycoides subsp. capri]QVK05307.1 transcription antitermination factor NusB [Mycoplasma mycoides subsp. capri]QVK08618.1 transcription antitermination factor NusB [Mycoplasma mycoides subsp. capri]QVK09232.1 transcription antitermination factor NusB [Mycoplasma mycoides subsp. cap
METKISFSKKRKLLIQTFYKYQLLNASIDYIHQDILDDVQNINNKDVLFEIEQIAKKQTDLINHINTNVSSNWKWDRIPAVIRAILIVGTYEILYTNTPKPVTINEMVKYVKEIEPDFDYKFVNAVLDKLVK